MGSPTVRKRIRKAVRFQIKNGADVIKAAVSGGVLSMTDEVDAPAVNAGGNGGAGR